jgi:hypothetical protein
VEIVGLSEPDSLQLDEPNSELETEVGFKSNPDEERPAVSEKSDPGSGNDSEKLESANDTQDEDHKENVIESASSPDVNGLISEASEAPDSGGSVDFMGTGDEAQAGTEILPDILAGNILGH